MVTSCGACTAGRPSRSWCRPGVGRAGDAGAPSRPVDCGLPEIRATRSPGGTAAGPGGAQKVSGAGGELFQEATFGGSGLVSGSADAWGVPEHIHVAGLPGDSSVGRAVLLAVVQVVPPGSRGRAFAGRQGHVHRPGAERGAGADQHEHGGAVDAGAHRRTVRWPSRASRVPCRVRVVTMTAAPRSGARCRWPGFPTRRRR